MRTSIPHIKATKITTLRGEYSESSPLSALLSPPPLPPPVAPLFNRSLKHTNTKNPLWTVFEFEETKQHQVEWNVKQCNTYDLSESTFKCHLLTSLSPIDITQLINDILTAYEIFCYVWFIFNETSLQTRVFSSQLYNTEKSHLSHSPLQ